MKFIPYEFLHMQREELCSLSSNLLCQKLLVIDRPNYLRIVVILIFVNLIVDKQVVRVMSLLQLNWYIVYCFPSS